MTSPRSCLICRAASSDLVGEVMRGSVRRCRSCGQGFVDPVRAVPDEQLYGTEFFDAFDELEFQRSKSEMFAAHVGGLEEVHPPGRTLIDVGAATGDFVAYASERGWEAVGIEPMMHAVDVATKRGRLVRQGTIGNHPYQARRFDVVHCSHVIEHVDEPESFLGVCRDQLVDGGVLALEVPNEFDNWFDRAKRLLRRESDPGLTDQHLWFFTPSTIATLVARVGFRVALIRTRNTSSLSSEIAGGAFVKRMLDRISTRFGGGQVIEVYARKI